MLIDTSGSFASCCSRCPIQKTIGKFAFYHAIPICHNDLFFPTIVIYPVAPFVPVFCFVAMSRFVNELWDKWDSVTKRTVGQWDTRFNGTPDKKEQRDRERWDKRDNGTVGQNCTVRRKTFVQQ